MSRKKISARRLAANRANARKSTGPRTPEGKARSRMNAVKHGMLAESIVVLEDQGESKDELQALRARFRNQIAPQGPWEELLVERLLACYWRLRRAYRFEVQTILESRERGETPLLQMGRELAGLRTPRPALLPAADDFDKLLRYEGLIDRTLHRITLQLVRLRTTGLTVSPDEALKASLNTGAVPPAIRPGTNACTDAPATPSTDSVENGLVPAPPPAARQATPTATV
jgi:hypothetical protein